MSAAPLLLALGARSTVARLLRQSPGFDLFDAHYYYPDGAAAALLASWFGKPFVVTARGSDLNVLPDYAVPRRWIRWTEAHAAASITVSDALKGKLVELGGDEQRISVLRNGVDLGMFELRDRDECRLDLGLTGTRWLLSVGNLIGLKGHHIAIEALRMLPADVRLAIVGEGEDSQRLRALADRFGVSDRVRFAGAVPQRDLVAWYNMADVLVLCSSREGLPNVLLESLACGTPVVTTAVGGIPEVIRSPEVGRCLKQRTPAAVADAVRDVFSSGLERERIRAFASQFDWRETTEGQLALFRSIVGNERPSSSFAGAPNL